jgi:small GTP-binding protein
MLGSFSVGKTSLVERYVRSIFSDKYLSTVGVKISKKELVLDSKNLTLVLWDMEGKDDYVDINISYLRGAMGFFVVVDLSRKETLDAAMQIRKMALDIVGADTPNIILLNKCDLDTWEITNSSIDTLSVQGIECMKTSARLDQGVEEAFLALTKMMLA